ncbi:MAG: DUF2271 domain-containing protein [Candidatus Krumholzibacteria bacterium]|nr:DUF2271 domain-containing protein [Candidatus Krumholzibacteria bacterium]
MRPALSVLTIILIASSICCDAAAKDIESYISEARALADGRDYAAARALMEEAAAAFPQSPDALAYLGLYTGMSAGGAGDYMEAGRLAMSSFEILDRAVSLGPDNPLTWLFRGIMGVNVPEFMGRLDAGISDLSRAVEMLDGSGPGASPETLVTALSNLAAGFAKTKNAEGEQKALEKIMRIAPGSEAAAGAQKRLEALSDAPATGSAGLGFLAPAQEDSPAIASLKESISKNPADSGRILDLGKAWFEKGNYEKARQAFRRYTEIDHENAEAYKFLYMAVGGLAGKGYDRTIYDDTNYRSGLAFEAMAALDRAVNLAPGDMELRLMRGISGIEFPFFLGKHDQGVADLEIVASGAAVADTLRARALYYLGVAKQREAMRYWVKVAVDHPESGAAAMVYGAMRPETSVFDPEKHEKPFVKIDFVLGFEDELPPQTAVWVENGNGEYVATVYASGFAGFVKEKQVTLPLWAASSGFEGVDAVTTASIDVGHYVYLWDLRDFRGEKVKKGKYTVKVETCYWPSMKYQMVEAVVAVGGKGEKNRVEEGNFIPFLEVGYYAGK